ncbi:MAG TPA: DUF3303 family protein [Chloroflexota bacterium]|nr:DUF3303 family protein [Chloroflexota bacterium]
MLYLLIEHYKPGRAEDVYRRFRDHGRLAPAGVEYLASWVETGFSRCFQVMRAERRELLEAWMEQWVDLVEFEVVEVRTSADAAEVIAPRL